ncbi:MAG: TIGR02281 family clan AA aspartic protease [Alphaproteobacteria bacterium]|nr:TIGR02281 family clan AA aspartic protease [Alphaproteobacteria bacterium]
MHVAINPDWQQLLPYAIGGAVLLVLLFNIPYVGRVLRALFSVALLALALFVLLQQAPFDPTLSQITRTLGLDRQEVSGREVRVPMAPGGHFWVEAQVNGVSRRMLVDSGATVTVLSAQTARQAGVPDDVNLLPVRMRTAGGTVEAHTGTVKDLRIGGIEARGLKVLISPALGGVDVLGMNFLSQLASWRVEGGTLVLTPKGAIAAGGA